ncbi:hypothetical protein P154DRAFT_420482 [Amniculicola lignicola CBS 123094]|uniref:Uncharacterized protein n=1 Tax=Amniculicola lignicola CBS 123094 TaxID=1392246 RepID=A0A6A5X3T3_9PLEO|nr:hypothetical protein P154DRAFT_420482 [Amniculicola lignicola CBS 123094]
METSSLLRSLLRAPPAYRTLLSTTTRPRPQTRAFALLTTRYISTDNLPRIIQPSFWNSIIPPSLRRIPTTPTGPTPKEWNPATIYIVLGLLVGSQAIQILWLKRDHAHMVSKAEAKLGLLKEVVEKVRKGEDVDVEKELGTGVLGRENEWKRLLEEVEGEETLFRSRRERRAARVKGKAEEAGEMVEAKAKHGVERAKVETYKGARFY